jgi:hypothetical protein
MTKRLVRISVLKVGQTYQLRTTPKFTWMASEPGISVLRSPFLKAEVRMAKSGWLGVHADGMNRLREISCHRYGRRR